MSTTKNTNIDRDRGCLIRIHPSGGRTVMYVDEPGVYFNEDGSPATREQAAQAGFEVEKHDQEHKQFLRRKKFERRLREESEDDDDRPQGIDLASLKVTPSERRKNRFDLVDAHGNIVNANPLTESQATNLLTTLGGSPDDDDEEAEDLVGDDDDDDLVGDDHEPGTASKAAAKAPAKAKVAPKAPVKPKAKASPRR